MILDSPFNDELDEYEDAYAVYVLPEAAEAPPREASLGTIAGLEPVARIPIADVEFDSSRRKALRCSSLKDLAL